MSTSKSISKLGFFATIAATGAAIVVGCGGDTVSVNELFGGSDASTAVDATTPVADSGTAHDAATDGAVACATDLTSCNGACVDTQTDAANCGSCQNTCSGGYICAMGTCALSCNGGSLVCGNSCVDETADPGNCGACSHVCAAGQVCSLSKCATTCASGLTRCTSASSDGGAASDVCVDDSSDANNCGGCGIKCGAGQLCSNGTCGTSCLTGLIQCGTKCIDPTSNNAFCGATAGCGATGSGGSAGAQCTNGTVCTTGTSGGGTCATTCAPNEILCGGVCIDPTSDRNNCGAKGLCSDLAQSSANYEGASCAMGQACVAASGSNAPAVCATTCLQGEVLCNGACIDPLTNNLACGAKGNCTTTAGDTTDSAGANCITSTVGGVATPLGETCSNGTCQLNCAPGQVKCNGACVDPDTNGNHCGASGSCTTGTASAGKVCAAGTVCTGGSCTVTCQSGQVLCGATCVDPATNPEACGAKGNCTNVNVQGSTANSTGAVCVPGTFCSAGSCAAACSSGYVLCSGVCVNPADNNGHCGATTGCGVKGVGSTGSVCAAGTLCEQTTTGGVTTDACSINCSAGLAICPTGNACVDEQHDPNNCGASCVSCAGADTLANPGGTGGAANNVATAVCRTGTCAVAACATGWADCNGDPTDGCEVHTATDANNCGKCAAACSQNNGTETCNGGSCTAATCATGFADCDKNVANGCEVNTTNNSANCGVCSTVCSGANASSTSCTASVCTPGACSTGFSDCDANPNNGCEVDSATDANNCGGCAIVCSNAGATSKATCSAGACSKPVCDATHGDCDGDPKNGCEVDLTSSALDCGSCGGTDSVCTGANAVATACSNSACTIGACNKGFGNCDNDAANGCESSTNTDGANCGGCGMACTGNNVCLAAACAIPTSCADILASFPKSTDGVYTIQPQGAPTPFQVYCDMTNDGGGWTLVMKAANDDTLAFDAHYWNDGTLLNETDLTPTAGTNSVYQSFATVAVNEVRGILDGYVLLYLPNATYTSSVDLFSTDINDYESWPASESTDTNPNFGLQPYCHVYGIDISLGGAQSRFGWQGNENAPGDCTSNDSTDGFGTFYNGDLWGAGYFDTDDPNNALGHNASGAGTLWVR